MILAQDPVELSPPIEALISPMPAATELVVGKGERERALAPRNALSKFIASVFEKDDRQRVADTGIDPWSGICYVMIKSADGRERTGTAFLITQQWALTAAHVVWKSQDGAAGRAKSVSCDLGRNGASAGEVLSARYRMLGSYVGSGDTSNDVALLRLERPASANRFVFQLHAATAALLEAKQGKGFNIAGYPVETEKTLWRAVGHFRTVGQTVLTHRIDTCPGQSGGPVTYKVGDARFVVAIHTSGVGGEMCEATVGENKAVRLTPEILDWAQRVMAANP